MKYLTLDLAKKHCNIDADFTDDDDYITGLCDMTESIIETEIGDNLEDLETHPDFKRLAQAMLLMVAHFYQVREPAIIGVNMTKVHYGIEYLIAPFKNWTIC